MRLFIRRLSEGLDDTLGAFYMENRFMCFTLEDEPRLEKVDGETCIPMGRYRMGLRTEGRLHARYGEYYEGGGSLEHRGMLEVLGVPNFTAICIHCGNDDEDTDGCLLVGNQIRENVTASGYLGDSRGAYWRIYTPIADALDRGEEVSITILDAP